MSIDVEIDEELKFRMYKVGKVFEGVKKVFKCKSLVMSAEGRFYKGIVVPATLYGAETWNMGAAERRRLNIGEMRCLRSMCGVTWMDGVRNEEV